MSKFYYLTSDTTDGNANYAIYSEQSKGGDIGITAPGHLLHPVTHNYDEGRDDDMLVSKGSFLEACADSGIKLTRANRKIIKRLTSDEWGYVLARLLLGGNLTDILGEFKDEPILVKNVDA